MPTSRSVARGRSTSVPRPSPTSRSTNADVVWVDGKLLPRSEPAVRADDSAFAEGRGCYTSARVEAGRVRFLERHVQRLVAGAAELRLGELRPQRVRQAFAELAAVAFGEGAGIVRLQLSRDPSGALHLVGVPRALGPEPATWSAIVVGVRHGGEGLGVGIKATSRLALGLAIDAAHDAGADEALVLDPSGRLIEGARSNIVVVDAHATAALSPVADGGVAGITRGVVMERVREIAERAVPERELRAASEIVALNAVRGAVPITRLDGAPVGDGRAGDWAVRLAAAVEEAARSEQAL